MEDLLLDKKVLTVKNTYCLNLRTTFYFLFTSVSTVTTIIIIYQVLNKNFKIRNIYIYYLYLSILLICVCCIYICICMIYIYIEREIDIDIDILYMLYMYIYNIKSWNVNWKNFISFYWLYDEVVETVFQFLLWASSVKEGVRLIKCPYFPYHVVKQRK